METSKVVRLGYAGVYEDLCSAATILANEVIRNPKFKDVCLMEFAELADEVSNLKHLPPEIIYDRIFNKEDIVLLVKSYRVKNPFSSVIAFVSPPDPTIYLNSRKVNTYQIDSYYSVVRLASTLMHEYSHVMGSRHGMTRYQKSIGYGINRAFEAVAATHAIAPVNEQESDISKLVVGVLESAYPEWALPWYQVLYRRIFRWSKQ